jgi:hypothetical protein
MTSSNRFDVKRLNIKAIIGDRYLLSHYTDNPYYWQVVNNLGKGVYTHAPTDDVIRDYAWRMRLGVGPSR